jgi:Subtilase family
MDAVFDAQFRLMKDEFARRGVPIEVAYRPDGQVDHLYRADRMLVSDLEQFAPVIGQIVPGIRWLDPGSRQEWRDYSDLGSVAANAVDGPRECTSQALQDKHVTVPELLRQIDDRLGRRNPASAGAGAPAVSPDHVVHVSRICPAVEPEVPGGAPTRPWPAPRPSTAPAPGGKAAPAPILIGVSDTGLLENLDPARYFWLAGVSGEPDPLGPSSAEGSVRIPAYAGHGTFVAGIAKGEAPDARVLVNNHFSLSGGELESVIVAKLEALAAQGVDVINLSAGTYTRNNWTSMGFDSFHRRHPEIAFVAAAGNDSTDRPFYPAAYDWAVSVGALATDQRHRAWFSNYGPWVDVYALGEGMINAFATGLYAYHEPPKMPAVQSFDGMAQWSGTSFSAPLVAGLIAERMGRTGDDARSAVAAVLKLAQNQPLNGVGPALFPGDQA